MERKNAWLSYGESDEKEMEKLTKDYRAFLDAGKTERECVTELVREAEANGYVSLEAKQAAGEKIQPGDKVYAVGMKKIMALFHVGQEPLEKGMNILGAHIDSPRLDVKQNPLYEDTDLAYLDTHYYGGVKKYQWVALPLAIHGVIAKKDGSVVNVTIQKIVLFSIYMTEMCSAINEMSYARNMLKNIQILMVLNPEIKDSCY